MYSVHTLHQISLDSHAPPSLVCNCITNNNLKFVRLKNGCNTFDHDFLKGLLFLKSDPNLIIFSTEKNGIVMKYDMKGTFDIFIHNDRIYHITKKTIQIIYPEMKTILEDSSNSDSRNLRNIHQYDDKYFLLSYDTTNNNSKKFKIYNNNFEPYYNFPDDNIYSIKCMCNPNILILDSGKQYEYFDIENKRIIDSGNFVQWKQLFNKLVFTEYDQTSKLLSIKQICDYDEKIEANGCVICFSKIKNKIAFIPCGHTRVCEKCIKAIEDEKCPLCRKKYSSTLKIFT